MIIKFNIYDPMGIVYTKFSRKSVHQSICRHYERPLLQDRVLLTWLKFYNSVQTYVLV